MVSNNLPEGKVEYAPTSNWAGVINLDLNDPTLGPTIFKMIAKYCKNGCRLHLSPGNPTCNGFGSAGTTEGANLFSAETIKENSLPYLAECLRQQK